RAESGPSGKLMKLCCVMVGIGCLLTADFIYAGPPFVTDDPEPPPPGGWEINVPFILERTPGTTEMDAPLFDLNYGLPDIQLKLEFQSKSCTRIATARWLARAIY